MPIASRSRPAATKCPGQHQVDDLPPTVRAHGAAPDGAGDNIVPVARRPRIIRDFLTAIAGHDLGECIEPFQRMRLYREHPPIVVRCMGPCFHSRTLYTSSDDILDRMRTREVTGIFHSRKALLAAAQ